MRQTMQMVSQGRTLTTGEAAEMCGVSRSTLRRAVTQGQLHAWHTPGMHLRFTQADCLAFAISLGRTEVELVGRRYLQSTAPAPGPGTRPTSVERSR